MGKDYEAITVIGVRVPQSKLDGKDLTIKDDIIMDANFDVFLVDDISPSPTSYVMYREYYGCDYVDDAVYISVYAGSKDGPRNWEKDKQVKCDKSLAQLDEMRLQLREFLIQKGIFSTTDEFDESFGIYTFFEYSC